MPDIIACCKTDFHPDSLLLNDGHGHFVEAPDGAMPPIGDLFEPNATATGDFDGDGWDDLIEEWCPTTNPNDGGCSLRLSLNNRNGTFRDATGGVPQAGNYVLEHAELGGTYGLHAADLNGDGLPDILLNSGQLFLNVGGARFIDATELLPFNFAGQLLPGDLDGNGSIDILSPGGASFVVLRQLKAVSVDLFNPVERIHRHLRHASQ